MAPKLTKEEKKARKLAKIAAKKAAAEALRCKLKRDHLEREVAAHGLWEHSLESTLRKAMLQIKEPIYRQQIEVMWHTLDRAFDKKDGLINHIMNLKGIANNQYQRTIANFCFITDAIINNFLNDLEIMAKKNEIMTQETLEHGRAELAYYLESHKRAETHLNLLLYTSHQEFDTLAWNTRGENAVRRDEDVATYLEVREHLKYILEGAYSDMWEQYKGTVRRYILSTAENQKQVRKLRKKENMMADIIAKQAKQLIYAAKLIKRLRKELLAYETGEKQASFRARRDRHRTACYRLKKHMNQGLEEDQRKITILVEKTNEATDLLVAAQKKAEKILRLAALCRKYETQKEKVLPYGLDVPEEQVRFYSRRVYTDPMDVTEMMSTACGLANLWQHTAQAELSTKALLREREMLQEENALLECELLIRKKQTITIKPVPCSQCGPKSMKRKLEKPYAVEGTLEIKKFICN